MFPNPGPTLSVRAVPGQASPPGEWPCYVEVMHRRSLFLSLAIAGLGVPVSAFAARPAAGPATGVDVQAQFECLWWSEREMSGIDPNRPPPKTTRVRIAKWEYSDPIGVPHPDEVILVLRLRAAQAREVTLAPRVSWRLRGWQPAQALGIRRVTLAAGEARVEEFTIPVARMILDRVSRRMRVAVLLDGRQALQLELPIQGGD